MCQNTPSYSKASLYLFEYVSSCLYSSSKSSNIVLYATGRKPNLDGLNLDKVGVKLNDNGHVITDNHFKTSLDSVYALGDIIGTPELTPVAIEQAMAFVSTQYLNKPKEQPG